MCVHLDWLISFAQTFGFLSSTFFPLRGVPNGKRRILGEGYLKTKNKEVLIYKKDLDMKRKKVRRGKLWLPLCTV